MDNESQGEPKLVPAILESNPGILARLNHAVTSFAFCQVESFVSDTEEVPQVSKGTASEFILSVRCDPNADGQFRRNTAGPDMQTLNRDPDAVGNHDRTLRIGIRKQDGELFASVATCIVARSADMLLDAVPDGGQGVVTG